MPVKIRILSIIFIILFTALGVRLFWWQVIKSVDLSDQARNQYSNSIITKASRGNILASDGTPWVARTTAWNMWANTKIMAKTPLEVARAIAPLLSVKDNEENDTTKSEEERLLSLLSKKTTWVSLKNKIDDATKKNIEGLGITGINFDQIEASYYPEASTAAQILGFVGKDDNGGDVGYFGLEGYYNLILSGRQGFTSGEKDAKGSPILLNGSTEVSAISGVDLKTYIDKRVQILIEKKLKEGIEKYGASGGSVTVMDPKTGGIIAMASFPSFDPAKYSQYSDTVFRNPVISDTFEPGSIFKVLVMAAGLDAGVVKPDTKCDICNAPYKVDKYFIKTWNNKYTENISMTNVIVESDNVGMTYVGLKLGADNLYDYLRKFGIGEKTGVDLQGEVSPKMRDKGSWSSVDLATTTFGQGIAVTGIQMVRAVAAIANGGYLVTPRVVASIKTDGLEETIKKDSPVRIISEKTANEISEMMVKAVEEGEAKWTKIPGYRIAGKTGTAQIAVGGHYDETNTNHSFIGFASADDPKFVMLVTLKTPQSSSWAAETAAPLWFSIAKELIVYFGIQPSE